MFKRGKLKIAAAIATLGITSASVPVMALPILTRVGSSSGGNGPGYFGISGSGFRLVLQSNGGWGTKSSIHGNGYGSQFILTNGSGPGNTPAGILLQARSSNGRGLTPIFTSGYGPGKPVHYNTYLGRN